jgi:hypothetical protein
VIQAVWYPPADIDITRFLKSASFTLVGTTCLEFGNISIAGTLPNRSKYEKM